MIQQTLCILKPDLVANEQGVAIVLRMLSSGVVGTTLTMLKLKVLDPMGLDEYVAGVERENFIHEQREIYDGYDAFGEMVKTIWPRTYALFEEHDLRGERLSRTEAAEVRELIREWQHHGGDDASGILEKLFQRLDT